MSLLESLRFTRGDTVIHKLDPRVKFLMTLVFFSISVMYMHLIPLSLIFMIQIPLVLAAKVFQEWFKSIKGASFIAGFIFMTNMVSFYYFKDTWFIVKCYFHC